MAALIGPNAVLQLIPLIEPGFLARLGIEPPPDHGLMAEEPAHRLHAALRQTHPQASSLLAEAGRRTADYILAHRIPRPAQAVLRLMPGSLGIRVLGQAIARNAWTFAGLGRFCGRGGGAVSVARQSADPGRKRGSAALPLACRGVRPAVSGVDLTEDPLHRDRMCRLWRARLPV